VKKDLYWKLKLYHDLCPPHQDRFFCHGATKKTIDEWTKNGKKWKVNPNCPIGKNTFDKICMMMTRLACNRAIESSYWRMDNDSDVGLLTGYVLYWLPVELEFMDLDTFPH
jgi:hypothetical protein